MSLRLGLQGRYLLLVALAILVVLVSALLLWQRQSQTFAQLADASREAVHELTFEALQRSGEQLATDLATQLANPLYNNDIDRIGEFITIAMRRPEVLSIEVFDAKGQLLHDGSDSLDHFGEAVSLSALDLVPDVGARVQWDDGVMAVSHPILLGDEAIGGVRIRYSMAMVRTQQIKAENALNQRQQRVTETYRIWLTGLLAMLIVLATAVSFMVSRLLVQPIRALAEVARNVEAGRFRNLQLSSRRKDEIGDLIRSFALMVEGIERHEREMRRVAYTDSLTGLPNRPALRELLELKLSQQRDGGNDVAVLFVDLDEFKQVNDTLGHEAGDRVLAEMAVRIRESANRAAGAEVAVARFGGDEFVIVVEGTDVRLRSARVADAVIAALRVPVRLRGREQFVGASIGITVSPEDARSVSQLIKNCDIAMYQAKLAGKNCYRFYSRAEDDKVTERVLIENDLRQALHEDCFELHYQPVVALKDGTTVGVEALLRWRHPKRGLLLPGDFIKIAEHSGLIGAIGAWVLRRACADIAALNAQRAGQPPLYVSVNVSARQLRSGELPEQVAQALAQSRLAARLLRLELTENAALEDESQAVILLTRIRESGVGVWLDDFGTGFSGLSHLRRVPVDGVKIDRSFVADLAYDEDDVALTSAIIALAHTRGIGVVAEGVEQTSQRSKLAELGCDCIQGWLLAAAMDAPALAAWLERN